MNENIFDRHRMTSGVNHGASTSNILKTQNIFTSPLTYSQFKSGNWDSAKKAEFVAISSDDSVEDLSNDKKTKTELGTYTAEELKYLKDIFVNDQYPNRDGITRICRKLNRDYGQVYQWFARMRRKHGGVKIVEPCLHLNGRMKKPSASKNILNRPRTTSPVNHGASAPMINKVI